jgi:hypothetical protein
VVCVALVAVGCGSSSHKDGTALVAQIAPYGSAPQHVVASARATIPPSAAGLQGNAVAAALLASPVAATFTGDVAGSNARGEIEVEAGPLSVPGELRSVSSASYLRTGTSWYALGSAVDPAALTGLPTNLKGIVSGPRIVGSEEIDGASTQHVEAKVDPKRAVSLLQSATGTTIDLSRIDLRSASTDLFIDAAHHVRRLELTVDGRTSDGKSVRADLTLSVSPGAAFSVVAPTGTLPIADLPTNLAGSLLGGADTTSTPSLLPEAP